jgi:GNAT superfamily N-acetyltransferase
MPRVNILPCTVADIEAAPNLPQLLAEYAAESAIPELAEGAAAQVETYRQLEAAGMLHPIAASLDGELIGFVFVLISVLPHFGRKVALGESIFVARAARGTGAGVRLKDAAEALACECGAQAILFSAPIDGSFEAVLPHHGYRAVSTAFFKELT